MSLTMLAALAVPSLSHLRGGRLATVYVYLAVSNEQDRYANFGVLHRCTKATTC